MATTTFYIPIELWMLILPFLPVKTLLRIRAVSKFFFSSINSDSDLVVSHIRSFPNNLQKTHTINILVRINQLIWAINERNGDGTPSFYSTRSLSPASHRPPEVLTSLDGLILLKSTDMSTEALTVMLWNPSIRKTRNLSLPWSPTDNIQFGLGYDPVCNDYKVLAMLKWGPLWIYSVKTQYWTMVERKCCGMCDVRWWSEQLAFDGGVCWVMAFWDEYSGAISHRFVCFEFSTLKFRFAPMPYGGDEDGLIDRHLFLVMLKESDGSWPAVTGNSYGDVIWTIDLDTMVWTKRYSGTQVSKIYSKYWLEFFGFPKPPIVYIESLLLLN